MSMMNTACFYTIIEYMLCYVTWFCKKFWSRGNCQAHNSTDFFIFFLGGALGSISQWCVINHQKGGDCYSMDFDDKNITKLFVFTWGLKQPSYIIICTSFVLQDIFKCWLISLSASWVGQANNKKHTVNKSSINYFNLQKKKYRKNSASRWRIS